MKSTTILFESLIPFILYQLEISLRSILYSFWRDFSDS